MSDKYEPRYKSIGSMEMWATCRAMVDNYRNAKRLNASSPAQTWHGIFAEAEFRSWLKSFLPTTYGVTKGWVVGQRVRKHYVLREHDVIVYDSTKAQVLWSGETSDHSQNGICRAIPVEHVHAVLEVKATLTARHAKDALEKLKELNQLARPVGAMPGFQSQVKPNFVSGVVFFELRAKDQRTTSIINNLVSSSPILGYEGGIVLSAENDASGCSGKIGIVTSDRPLPKSQGPLFRSPSELPAVEANDGTGIKIPSTSGTVLTCLPDEADEGSACVSSEGQSADNQYSWYYENAYPLTSGSILWENGHHVAASLTWSRSMFAHFSNELLMRLQGKDPGWPYGTMYDGRFGPRR